MDVWDRYPNMSNSNSNKYPCHLYLVVDCPIYYFTTHITSRQKKVKFRAENVFLLPMAEKPVSFCTAGLLILLKPQYLKGKPHRNFIFALFPIRIV